MSKPGVFEDQPDRASALVTSGVSFSGLRAAHEAGKTLLLGASVRAFLEEVSI